MNELKTRRLIRNGDTVIFDKGYYSYDNYFEGIMKFKIVPLVFPKKGFDMDKLLGKLSYPLSVFNKTNVDRAKAFFNDLVKRLKEGLENWKSYKPIRGMIEDIFKVAKNAFSLKKIHRYTKRSVEKVVCLNVLLLGIVVSISYRSKEELQRFAEW